MLWTMSSAEQMSQIVIAAQLVVLIICWLYHSSQKTIDSHLSRHGGKVPHAADDSPTAHHSQQVVDHSKFTAIPEGISIDKTKFPFLI